MGWGQASGLHGAKIRVGARARVGVRYACLPLAWQGRLDSAWLPGTSEETM